MITLRALLDRIRWDPEFGHGELTLGYYDRIERRVVSVPFARIHLVPGNHFSFTAIAPDVAAHDVPFHRVREVRRDGRVIRERPGQRGAA